jgi:hypothetical protein
MQRRLAGVTAERGLFLSLGLAMGLGAAACGDPGSTADCNMGGIGCDCFAGNLCLNGLTCLSGICVQLGDDGETGEPGDGDPGDGDPGDGDPGDGDPGDGDPGDGDPGDGDGDPAGSPCGDGAEVRLYAQGDDFSNGSGILVGSFTDLSNKSVEVADDFVVPEDEGCWCVTRVTARGFYNDAISPANTPDVIVEFFEHNPAGVPKPTAEASYTSAPLIDIAGEFDVEIDEDIVLPAGTHWFSFRPMINGSEVIWYWLLADTVIGDVAAARDKDAIIFDGLCSGWTPANGCYTLDPESDNQLTMQFEIYGLIGGQECN